MRKIPVDKWKAKEQHVETGADGKEKLVVKDIDETSLEIVKAVLNAPDQQGMRGFDGMRMQNQIADAIDKAEKSGVLELEDAPFSYLKNKLERLAPEQWGQNKHIFPAVEKILNTPAEK